MERVNDRKAWDNISKMYSKLIIPNRPSLGDIENYGRIMSLVLGNKKNPKIMIMGSTPELRSAAYRFRIMKGAKVFCVDISENMYEAMNNFCVSKQSNDEKYLERSWLKTGFKKDYFDLILGDEVICNIPFESQDELFKEISRILKKNGAWVTRHNFSIGKDEVTNPKEIIEYLAINISNGNINFDFAVNLLFVDFFYYAGWHNPLDNSMESHLKVMKKEYLIHFKKHPLKKIVKELIDLYDIFWVSLSGNHNWSIVSRKDSEIRLKKFFKIGKKLYSNDYPTAKNSPIYLLSKK
ncbi:MAG: class I SAM-dependent methyltransferase [Parcubacteria group bacterium]